MRDNIPWRSDPCPPCGPPPLEGLGGCLIHPPTRSRGSNAAENGTPVFLAGQSALAAFQPAHRGGLCVLGKAVCAVSWAAASGGARGARGHGLSRATGSRFWFAGTTIMSRGSSVPWARRCGRVGWGSGRGVIGFGTVSPRIYWRPATTFARSRSYWGTGTCRQR